MRTNSKIVLSNKLFGKDEVFVIAEIGNNHNGSFKKAIDLIDKCIEIGADCVKFQMRNLESYYL